MAATIVAIFVSAALIVIALTAVLNSFTMFRLGAAPAMDVQPTVSVLIPARNEAAVIGDTVRSLLNQDYANLELLLLDDNSSDGTADIARAAANGDARLRVIGGAELPDGWAGKNWACHQLSEQASGDWLIFTDADVQWQDGALAAVMNQIAATQADLLTVWSTQITETPGERLVVPLMALVILGYLPHIAVNRVSMAAFAAANGQCMAFRRQAYQAIGGHTSVKSAIVEDIQLARAVKRAGYKLRMTDGNQRVVCRMYDSWDAVRNGYAKNIIAGYGDSVPALLASAVFHWLVFVYPWLWLIVSAIAGNLTHALWAGLLVILGVGVRALTAAATHQRVTDALFMPASVIAMTIIAAQGIYWYVRYGGPRWKGRTIPQRKQKRTGAHG